MEKIPEPERQRIRQDCTSLQRYNSSLWEGVHPLLDQKDLKQVIDTLEQSVPRLLAALDEAYRYIDAMERDASPPGNA